MNTWAGQVRRSWITGEPVNNSGEKYARFFMRKEKGVLEKFVSDHPVEFVRFVGHTLAREFSRSDIMIDGQYVWKLFQLEMFKEYEKNQS